MQYVAGFCRESNIVYLIDEETLELEKLSYNCFLDKIKTGMELKDSFNKVRVLGKYGHLENLVPIGEMQDIAKDATRIDIRYESVYSHTYYRLSGRFVYSIDIMQNSWRRDYFHGRLGSLILSDVGKGTKIEYEDGECLFEAPPPYDRGYL